MCDCALYFIGDGGTRSDGSNWLIKKCGDDYTWNRAFLNSEKATPGLPATINPNKKTRN